MGGKAEARIGLVTGIIGVVVGLAGLWIAYDIRGGAQDLDVSVATLNTSVSRLEGEVVNLNDGVGQVSDAIDDLNADVARLSQLVAPTTAPPPEAASVFSALAASSDVSEMIAQHEEIGLDSAGSEVPDPGELLVPVLRDFGTGLCLWVDDTASPTSVTSRSCDEIRAEVIAGAAGAEHPIYYGWFFDKTGDTQLNDVPVVRWRMCFAGSVSGFLTWAEWTTSMSCLVQSDGAVAQSPWSLVPHDEVGDAPSTAFLPAGTTGALYSWGNDGNAFCMTVNPETGLVGSGDVACDQAQFALDLAQWVFFRSIGR